jgi:hypothetical protein
MSRDKNKGELFDFRPKLRKKETFFFRWSVYIISLSVFRVTVLLTSSDVVESFYRILLSLRIWRMRGNYLLGENEEKNINIYDNIADMVVTQDCL